MRFRMPFGARAAFIAVLAFLTFAPAAMAAVDEVNTKKLRQNVTVNGILQHERKLQRIANMNGGTRASGTAGLRRFSRLREGPPEEGRLQGLRAGRSTSRSTRSSRRLSSSQVSPTPKDYETATYDYSGTGDVTGTVTPIDVVRAARPHTTRARRTAAARRATSPAAWPAVALVQRGGCDFVVKAENAAGRRLDAAIIFNEGQPGRTDLFVGTLGGPTVTIPVVGAQLRGRPGALQRHPGRARRSTSSPRRTRRPVQTTNVIADSKKGDAAKTLVVGAHLDSVIAGPGINDNGSGTSTILEIAEELSEAWAPSRARSCGSRSGAPRSRACSAPSTTWTRSTVDEFGTSCARTSTSTCSARRTTSASSMTATGRPRIRRVRPARGRSRTIFTQYFASQGLASEPTAFNGRSDYGPFIAVGIPAGGLFSGAEGVKTAAQAADYGGTAGEAYDPCYHQACDTITNLSTTALNELGDAAAHATLTLARTKSGLYEDGSRRGKVRQRAMTFDGPHAKR